MFLAAVAAAVAAVVVAVAVSVADVVVAAVVVVVVVGVVVAVALMSSAYHSYISDFYRSGFPRCLGGAMKRPRTSSR